MKSLGLGLIGTGFMGKAHALAFGSAHAVMTDCPEVHLAVLCDTPLNKAETMAQQFGFARATDSWFELVNAPEVDIVSITTPNALHYDMAIAAMEAGKHVYCEKPLALTLEQAMHMRDVARSTKVKTIVGYNYIKNPIFMHACRLIERGEIGEIVHFRGWVDEDYQADPNLEWTWRAKLSDAGLGSLGDLGCHLVSMAYCLVGPIESLVAEMQTVHKERPLPNGEGTAQVENEDVASALVRFSRGIQGSLSTSRSAWGRKNRLAWEVHGTKGMICFDQERMNELHVYRNAGTKSEQGFTKILAGPCHPPYGEFCPAPGHQLGFNDLKVIEASTLLNAIRVDTVAEPDFEQAYQFEKAIHAIAQSARTGNRVHLKDL